LQEVPQMEKVRPEEEWWQEGEEEEVQFPVVEVQVVCGLLWRFRMPAVQQHCHERKVLRLGRIIIESQRSWSVCFSVCVSLLYPGRHRSVTGTTVLQQFRLGALLSTSWFSLRLSCHLARPDNLEFRRVECLSVISSTILRVQHFTHWVMLSTSWLLFVSLVTVPGKIIWN